MQCVLVAKDGSEAPYDRLLIATGSTPFMLPIPGNDLPGVIGRAETTRKLTIAIRRPNYWGHLEHIERTPITFDLAQVYSVNLY